MQPTKPCEQCGKIFEKPYTCSRADWKRRRFCSMDCKKLSQVGQPSKTKGRKIPSTKPIQMLPCRICGKPTKYHGSPKSWQAGKVHCGDPICAEQSKQQKNEAIRARHTSDYATGKRKKVRHTWNTVQRISPEEIALTPFMQEHGFEPQFKLLTGVHTNTLPRQFVLDFALPSIKLYVEIDGSVHRLRKERDARRDAMLAQRGWRGLRITARRVRESPDDVKSDIALCLEIHELEARIDNLT